MVRYDLATMLITGGRGNTDPAVVDEVTAAWRHGRHARVAEAGLAVHVRAFDRLIHQVRDILIRGG
jgi:hypothetical protein